jgi:hypothetical protein
LTAGNDGKALVYDHDTVAFGMSALGGSPDAAAVTFTPTTATDWNTDADPGNVDGALDQLAARVDDLEAAGGGTNVATDPLWDVAGDLAQGTGNNTGARLPIGTANQLLRVNSGATAAEWASVGRVLISEATPTGTSVSFTSIPNTYKSLYLEYVARSDRSGQTTEVLNLEFNADTTATNYRRQRLSAIGAAASAATGDDNTFAGIPAVNATAGQACYGWCRVIQYAGTAFNKIYINTFLYRSAATTNELSLYSAEWESTNAITRIDIVTVNGSNFVSGTTFRLYGEN